LLLANAGSLPLDLPDDLSGKRGYIATTSQATSGLLNVRHKIGSSVEIFVDGLGFRNTGRWAGAPLAPTFLLNAEAPGNPFGQAITVSFPMNVLNEETSYRLDTRRWTTGAIVDLPRGWKASADYTVARSLIQQNSSRVVTGILLAPGLVGSAPTPSLEPFGDWAALVATLPAYVQVIDADRRMEDRLHDASLRVAGPLLMLPGGPLTATVVGEAREDRVTVETSGSTRLPPRTERARSGYLEFRAPLGASDADNLLLRGLEMQLAVRYDHAIQQGPVLSLTLDQGADRFSVADDATMFTIGARALPTRRLMLRASLATGERPPRLSDFQGVVLRALPFGAPRDPRRDGRQLGSEGPWSIYSGGSTRIGSSRARSVTVGAVVNPEGRGGPRVSLDYSRIVVSGEPAAFPLSSQALLAAEAQYPDRVIRAPVTAADTADGLTAGRVIALDTSVVNAGRTVVEAVDFEFDWRLPQGPLGDFRLYSAVTWEPTFRSSPTPGGPATDKVGAFGGPLEWRGNAGLEWTRSPLSVDLNVQYYGSYQYRDTERVPAQAYLDLSVRRRFTMPLGPGPLHALEARLSVQNLLDQSPPIVASSPDLGFSEYGDPRRRRFVAVLSAQF
jgi:hypothetical protein